MIRQFAPLLCALALATSLSASNDVQLENARAGTPGWGLPAEADGQIEGYASASSVNRGESIDIFVNTADSSYTLEVFRVGWYGGIGARRVAGPIVRTGRPQVVPSPDPVTGLIECNWTDPYTLATDPSWTTGVYLVRLTTNTLVDSHGYAWGKWVLFVLRDDSSHANHYFTVTDSTFQAYNSWGGKSLYPYNSTGGVAADKVSFNRPYANGAGTGDFLWRWEYPMVRFLEREGFDLAYGTSTDLELRGSLLLNHRDLLSVGHDEYWSWNMRANVESAIAAGVNAAFFSANDCYWQIRFEPGTVGGAPDRTMVGYKEDARSRDPYAIDSDPSNDQYITGTWRDAPVSRPEAAFIGVMYVADPVDADIVIDDVTSAPWVFANSGLTSGSHLPGLLGYEVDKMAPSTPVGTIRLGHSPFTTNKTNGQPQISDNSDMTLYTHQSGALVFATGSIQWAWGLDDWAQNPSRVNAGAQQITRNVLRRFAGVNAAADCLYSPSTTAITLAPSSGTSSFEVTADGSCNWTVTSSAPWIHVTSPASGSGSTTVTFSYDANASIERTATIDVADTSVTVTQGSGCVYALGSTAASFGDPGGTGSFTVTANSPDCPWSAVADQPWITITAGSSGSGAGTVSFSVASSRQAARDGAIDVAGATFAIHQDSGCSYAVTPSYTAFPASGGSVDISVSTDQTCYWSSSTSTPWIVLRAPTEGRGPGTVSFDVQTNTTGVSRTGTVAVAGNSVTVTQTASTCTYQLSPEYVNLTGAAASGAIAVRTSGDCSWNASIVSGSSFITITSAASGQGNGRITYSVSGNSASTARSGTIRVETESVRVTQSPGTPISLSATGSGTTVSLSWTAVAGASGYDVLRSTAGDSMSVVGSSATPSFSDAALAVDSAYVYQVRAMSASGVLAYSNIDVATTVTFTDPTLVQGVTTAKAAHVTDLRTAVDALRNAARLPPAAWATTVAPGVLIRASDIAALRSALDEARAALGLPPLTWSDPTITAGVTPIRAAHIEQLRAGVR